MSKTKEYTISQELFETVLNYKLNSTPKITDNKIRFYHKNKIGDYPLSMPIDEFFFRCKEWAKEHVFSISSGYDNDIGDGMYFCEITGYKFNEKFAEYEYDEKEAVFVGCQWLVEHINK